MPFTFVPSQEIVEYAQLKAQISEDECMEMLVKQISFYFSRQNLVKDTFMLSKMTTNMQLPTDVVFNFHKIQAITNDFDLFITALKKSGLFVTEDRVLVSPKVEHSKKDVVLMKQLPSSSTETDVLALFDETKPELAQIDPTTWTATFPTEKQASMFVQKNQELVVGDKAVSVTIKPALPMKTFLDAARADGLEVADFDVSKAMPVWFYRQRGPRGDKSKNTKKGGKPRGDKARKGGKVVKDAQFPALGSVSNGAVLCSGYTA
ncbi:La domain [Carpediemonas membranifera]|uniref:La domain n=1 Tax=Carpediemonas membranifera TaxID=201153 RepID=A0A8J6E5A6_9EUKA|nr:La domain [Carpediemonas membranifera]|eukprot:KAG9395497.1 La domain [Carpediemonas membranifera]